MIRIFTALAAMALASSASAQTEAQVDAIFGGLSEATPGCAVGIERRGQERLLRAYGAADLEHNAPITPETVFNVGSVSKQFTAAAILMLAEDGRLRLDDDVRKHVPELPDYGRPSLESATRGQGAGSFVESWYLRLRNIIRNY